MKSPFKYLAVSAVALVISVVILCGVFGSRELAAQQESALPIPSGIFAEKPQIAATPAPPLLVVPVPAAEQQQPVTGEKTPKPAYANAQEYVAALARGEEKLACKKNGIITNNPAAKKQVALTFDDGPFKDKTNEYIAILEKYDVPATFFVLGQLMIKTPKVAQNIVNSGHEIASHSWYHHDLPKKDAAFIEQDFKKTAKMFEDTVGFTPVLFRPPYGSRDERVLAAAKKYGMQTVLWNIDTLDWKEGSADGVYNRIMKDVSSGSIILMHENKKVTKAVLPRVIKALQDKGYEFVTVSELLYQNGAAVQVVQ